MKPHVFATVGVLSLCLAHSYPAMAATTRYVALDGGNTPPYTSWATAAHVIQDAVDAAVAGDTVLVSNGVYATGLRVTPGCPLSNRVVIATDILLQSLNGPQNTCILGAQSPGGGNGVGAVRCVYMLAGVLDGFTISNGHTMATVGVADALQERIGGGVCLTNGCMVTNCTVVGNSAIEGGGLFCIFGGTVGNATIMGNNADSGGGVYSYGGGLITGCTILSNAASLYGGGVFCAGMGDRVLDSTVSGNSALYWGGGVYSSGLLSNCTISANTSLGNGGGLRGMSGIAIHCTIVSNHAVNQGGGVYTWSAMTLLRCTIARNTADNAGGGVYGYGGVLSACIVSGNVAGNEGGGVYCHAVYLTNCLIASGNVANYGGGIYVEGGCVAVHCTVSSNTASIQGGGVYFYYGGGFVNTIIYHNAAGQSGDNWHSTTNAYTPFFLIGCCTTPTNGLPIYYGGISDPPLFCTPGSDYHLLEGSPCIDAGYYMHWPPDFPTDLDGNPRRQGAGYDIGCYETVPESATAVVVVLLAALWRHRMHR